MNSTVRLLTGLPGAVLVTGILFVVLATLIASNQDVQLSEDKSVKINVTRQIRDSTQQDAAFERPVLDQPPPPPPAVSDPDFRPQVGGQVGELPDFSKANLEIGTGFNPDRDAQPLVRIPPQYPSRCQSRATGAERVVLQFDVSPDGQVVNAEVLESTNSCFNRAARRAVQQWKYDPKIVDNEPQPRFGVRTSFTFRLGE